MHTIETIRAKKQEILGALPYRAFGDWPTPVERLEAMETDLGVEQLWIKRDDLSARLYGGNKIRKLEFLLADAVATGHQSTLTIGAIGSHHVLATSIYAREFGLTPAAQHYPQPITPHVLDNLRALSTTKPELSLVGHPVALPFKLFKRKLQEWMSQREDTYFITGGGSSPLGTVGYVIAGLELAEQVAEGVLEEPDVIYVAAGTMGTLSGLMMGCKMAGMKSEVIGVRVVDKIVTNAYNAAKLAKRCAAVMREAGITDVPHISQAEVTMLDQFFGPAYGEPTDAGQEAIEKMASLANIKLDPTYTGKAFSAIPSDDERDRIRGKKILYWHTLSGADLSERIASADPMRDLPSAYHGFFDH
jgi:D-cysteine desulfhydrase